MFLGTGIPLDQPQNGEREVFLSSQARQQGVYVIGTTGTGKTTLLKSMAVQDMEDTTCPALIVLDPHGDLVDELLGLVPNNRRDQTVLFSPGDRLDQYDYPIGLNILACDRTDPHERELVSSTVISTLYKLFFQSWGPRMEDLLRNTVLTLMERQEATLLDMWVLLAGKLERQNMELSDPFQWRFWNYFNSLSAHDQVDIAGSSLNKIGRFLGNPIIRNVIAQADTSFSVREIINNNGILFCNLSKGDLGEDNSSLLGSVIINQVLLALLARREMSVEERGSKPVHLIVDEYQTFASESFPILQSEARKYGMTISVAHQYRDQLDDLNKGSTMNCGNFVCLRVSGRDSMELASQFDNTPPAPDTLWQPVRYEVGPDIFPDTHVFERDSHYEVPLPGPRRMYNDVAAERANQLSTLPNYHALVRVLENHQLASYRVALSTGTQAPPNQRQQEATAKRIRAQSRERYGRDRRIIERQIAKRLMTLPAVPEKGKLPPSAS